MLLIIQILFGTVVIIVTVMIQVFFISSAVEVLTKRGDWLANPPFVMKTSLALVLVVLWLIVGISLSAWLWAAAFLMLGIFQSLEPALYFSIVTFTTLGYGELTLNPEWRIFASFAAVNGLIIFGLNTAFLVEFTSRLRATQESNMRSNR